MKEIRRITIKTIRRLRLFEFRTTCQVCGCEVTVLSTRDSTGDDGKEKGSSPPNDGTPLLLETKQGTTL